MRLEYKQLLSERAPNERPTDRLTDWLGPVQWQGLPRAKGPPATLISARNANKCFLDARQDGLPIKGTLYLPAEGGHSFAGALLVPAARAPQINFTIFECVNHWLWAQIALAPEGQELNHFWIFLTNLGHKKMSSWLFTNTKKIKFMTSISDTQFCRKIRSQIG